MNRIWSAVARGQKRKSISSVRSSKPTLTNQGRGTLKITQYRRRTKERRISRVVRDERFRKLIGFGDGETAGIGNRSHQNGNAAEGQRSKDASPLVSVSRMRIGDNDEPEKNHDAQEQGSQSCLEMEDGSEAGGDQGADANQADGVENSEA